MSIFTNIKNKIFGNSSDDQNINSLIYLNKGAALICKDKTTDATLQTKIVAEHLDSDADVQIMFPRFSVIKTISKGGNYGMHSKLALVLDTDESPAQNSKNLLTSGTLFNIINDLQAQIDELKTQLNIGDPIK